MLAGVNFVNLLTARATRRALEVGVRKGAGALPHQLMIQFMGESLGYALAGALLGMVMAELFLPTLNAFLDRRIALDPWNHPLLAVAPCVVAVLLGLAAGFYPAFVMFHPGGNGAQGAVRRVDWRQPDATEPRGISVHRNDRAGDRDDRHLPTKRICHARRLAPQGFC